MLVCNDCNHLERRAYQHGVLDTIHNSDAVEENNKHFCCCYEGVVRFVLSTTELYEVLLKGRTEKEKRKAKERFLIGSTNGVQPSSALGYSPSYMRSPRVPSK